jgi:hypothetical protein
MAFSDGDVEAFDVHSLSSRQKHDSLLRSEGGCEAGGMSLHGHSHAWAGIQPALSARKELVTWHDSVEDHSLAQREQAARVAANARVGKPAVVISSAILHEQPLRWAIDCIPALYRLDRPTGGRCTPAALRAAGAPPIGCSRWLRDSFILPAEARLLIGGMERAMRGLFHQGGQTSLAPDTESALRQMGEDAHALYRDVARRVRLSVEADHGARPLYPAGALLTRIWAADRIPHDGLDVEPGHAYWNPHVDKANRASYDFSALLYLNSHCAMPDAAGGFDGTAGGEARGCAYDDAEAPEFAGGQFAWLDDERDVFVEPRIGRLLHFTGGLENLHRPSRVTAGTRYVLGMWFTCHPEREFRVEEKIRSPPNELRSPDG